MIIVTTEDDAGDTLKPRLMAAGADLDRVFTFSMGSSTEPVPIRVPQDADELGRRIAEIDAALVVIDPLMEFIDGRVDSHKSHGVRQAISSLGGIARGSGCAILTVFHLIRGPRPIRTCATRGRLRLRRWSVAGCCPAKTPANPTTMVVGSLPARVAISRSWLRR